MKNIMTDLSKIEDLVEEAIRNEIYGTPKPKRKRKTTTKKRIIPDVPKDEMMKLDEGTNEKVEVVKIEEKTETNYDIDKLDKVGETKTGEPKYSFLDSDNNIKEVTIKTAIKNEYKPNYK